jgi:hypothetical protein
VHFSTRKTQKACNFCAARRRPDISFGVLPSKVLVCVKEKFIKVGKQTFLYTKPAQIYFSHTKVQINELRENSTNCYVNGGAQSTTYVMTS